MEKAPYTTARL